MEANIVIACPPCSQSPPPGFTTVAVCDNCPKMVWLNKDLMEKKKESQSPCWCLDCIKKAGSDPNVRIKAINWEELCDIQKKGKKIGENLWDIGGSDDEQWKELEAKFFEHSEKINTQMLKHLENVLPALCCAYMAKLKIYDNIVDLGVACSLAAYVENILLNRKKKHGNAFKGYTTEQKTRIFMFIFGVRDAVDVTIEKHGTDPDQVEKAFCIADFTKGFDYWAKNLRERHGDS